MIVQFDKEDDGRIIADIPAVPGAMAYGVTHEEAVNRALAIALPVHVKRTADVTRTRMVYWLIGVCFGLWMLSGVLEVLAERVGG